MDGIEEEHENKTKGVKICRIISKIASVIMVISVILFFVLLIVAFAVGEEETQSVWVLVMCVFGGWTASVGIVLFLSVSTYRETKHDVEELAAQRQHIQSLWEHEEKH